MLGGRKSNDKGKHGCLSRSFIIMEKAANQQKITWWRKSSGDKQEDDEVQGVSRTYNTDLNGLACLFRAPRNKWIAQSWSTSKREKQNFVFPPRHSVVFGANINVPYMWANNPDFTIYTQGEHQLEFGWINIRVLFFVFFNIQNTSVTRIGSVKPSLLLKADDVSLTFTSRAKLKPSTYLGWATDRCAGRCWSAPGEHSDSNEPTACFPTQAETFCLKMIIFHVAISPNSFISPQSRNYSNLALLRSKEPTMCQTLEIQEQIKLRLCS